jgi:hypothetical protein
MLRASKLGVRALPLQTRKPAPMSHLPEIASAIRTEAQPEHGLLRWTKPKVIAVGGVAESSPRGVLAGASRCSERLAAVMLSGQPRGAW